MKNFLRLISFILILTMLSIPNLGVIAAEKQKLFITEVCYNPANKNGSDYMEYIEAVNLSDEAVDLTGGYVTYQNGSGTVKKNRIYTTAKSSLQPGQVAVFAIYGTVEVQVGLGYSSDDEIARMLDAFNEWYGSSVDSESFFVIPKYVSGENTIISNGFNLGNTHTNVTITINDASDTLLASANYNAATYNASSYSIGFSLLDDNTSHVLGTTSKTPGVVQPARYTVREGEDFTETIRFFEYNVCATGGESGESDDVVPDECLLIKNRGDYVLKTVADFDPDVAVFTEFNGAWWNKFQTFLNGEGSKYACWGHSDHDHTFGTQSGHWDTMKMIMYNTEKYNLLDKGYFWVSATPGIKSTYLYPGLQVQSAHCFSWVKLKVKETGATFCVLGIHFAPHTDYVKELNPSFGETAADAINNFEAELVISQMNKIANGIPVIVSGDFNRRENTEAYQILMSGGYEDARNLDRYAEYYKSNFAQFQILDPSDNVDYSRLRLPIDHIMLSEGDFKVEDYAVNLNAINDTYYASDHLPVQAVLTMKYVEPEYDPFTLAEDSALEIRDGYLYVDVEKRTVSDIVNEFMDPENYTWDESATLAGTGVTITYQSDPSNYVTLILMGDINGDGKITTVDYLRLKSYFNGERKLEPPYSIAADMDQSGKLTSADYLRIKRYFNGQ